MSLPNNEIPPDESRPPLSTPISSTMKLPQVLRRGSATDFSEKQKERDTRSMSIPHTERKSSLPTIPLRLRRRKTSVAHEHTEQELEAADRLGRLFFSLPSEIITEIVTRLTISDIFALRLTSRTFASILNYNGSIITREIFSQQLAFTTTNHIQTCLYPPPNANTTTATPSLHHLFTMLRRQLLVDRQIYHLLSFVQMKIYMTRTSTRVLSVSENRSRLIAAFQRPAWFVMHFFESYRDIVLRDHPTHTTSSAPNCSSCHECRDAAREVVATYPADDIMPAYHFYQLATQHLQIATRAPMSAGALERRLRGWSKLPVTEESLSIFVILGGIPEMQKVAMMQGSYNSRLEFVTDFVAKVRKAIVVNSILQEDEEQKKKNGGGVTKRYEEGNNSDLLDSVAPPFHILTQDHITSLPNIFRFFFDIWKDRINALAPSKEEIVDPYAWLQRVMVGSGLEFGNSRTPEPPLALGASPI